MWLWQHQPGGRCPAPPGASWCCAHGSQVCADPAADDIFPLSHRWTATTFWLASWQMVSVESSDTGERRNKEIRACISVFCVDKGKSPNRLLQTDSRTRNGQIQEVGYVGWCQQSSWSDTAAGAPFQSKVVSRLQTHQQHVPKGRSNTVSPNTIPCMKITFFLF